MWVSSKVGGRVVMVESGHCWEVRGWWGRDEKGLVPGLAVLRPGGVSAWPGLKGI